MGRELVLLVALAAIVCVVVGTIVGKKYPLSPPASFVSMTLLGVGTLGFCFVALSLLAMLIGVS